MERGEKEIGKFYTLDGLMASLSPEPTPPKGWPEGVNLPSAEEVDLTIYQVRERIEELNERDKSRLLKRDAELHKARLIK